MNPEVYKINYAEPHVHTHLNRLLCSPAPNTDQCSLSPDAFSLYCASASVWLRVRDYISASISSPLLEGQLTWQDH